MLQQMRPSAYHLRPSDVCKLILAATNFRDRTLIKSLWWLGLHRHELVALDIRDIDFERKRVTVRAGKGNKTRVIPIIDDEFLSDLKHLIGPRARTSPPIPSPLHRPLPKVQGLVYRDRELDPWRVICAADTQEVIAKILA